MYAETLSKRLMWMNSINEKSVIIALTAWITTSMPIQSIKGELMRWMTDKKSEAKMILSNPSSQTRANARLTASAYANSDAVTSLKT
jgi:hypothetical protein